MNGNESRISDRTIDIVIGNLLRWGLLVASLIVMTGGGLYLVNHGTEVPNYHIFHGVPSDLHSVAGIVRDAWGFSGRGVIQFGMLLLIATPVLRVAFAAAAFLIQKDKVYVGVTLIVLAVLLFSLAGGNR